jgi:hypothetical protein
MPIALGAQPSASPLPTGRVFRVIGGGPDGVMAWPGDSAYFWANTSQTRAMQIGPVNVPSGNYHLAVRAWLIQASNAGSWQNGVMMLRLTDTGNEVSDINVHSRSYTYVTSETTSHAGGGWQQAVIETDFYCSPGINYYVQLLGGGGGGNYYCSSGHLGMVGWTLGEGAY